jgi:hypothetical protein
MRKKFASWAPKAYFCARSSPHQAQKRRVLFHCMPQSLANGGPGLGTCMGPAKTAALVREAGFSTCEQLGIRSQTHLFYAAEPSKPGKLSDQLIDPRSNL